jgi:Bacterial SH3 domain
MKSLSVYLLSLVILLAGCGTPTQAPTMPPPPTSTIAAPTNTQTFTPTPEPVVLTGCVNTSSLRVRSSPGTSSEILGGLTKGICVSVIGRDRDAGWILVSSDELSGWVLSEYLDIDGAVNRLSVVRGDNRSSAQSADPTQSRLHEDFLYDFMLAIIASPQYDESANVLHKYTNSISIDIVQDTLTFTVSGNVENEDDFISLSYELIRLGAIGSKPGTVDDWGLQRIEVINPGPLDSFAQFYVDGANNILGIAEGRIDAFDVMEVEVSYGSFQTPTAVVRKTSTPKPPTPIARNTSTPRPEYIYCANTKSYAGSYVTCKIPFAYCEYQPSTSGSPTFCNDAPYPRNNFTLVFWSIDRSDLGGKCILVSGYVELYNGKPQIVADSSTQVSYCP